MGKWAASIVGSIIIGVVSWWLTEGLKPDPLNPPSSPVAPSHTSPEPPPGLPPPKVECNGEGGLSSPSLPFAPPKGCVLIAEWWYPRNPTSCGIWIAATAVPFSHGVDGHWWYVPPERVSPHIAEYKSKPNSVNCEVKDFR
jgi:hypothetical protein